MFISPPFACTPGGGQQWVCSQPCAGGAGAPLCPGCWDEARAAAMLCPLVVLAGNSEGPHVQASTWVRAWCWVRPAQIVRGQLGGLGCLREPQIHPGAWPVVSVLGETAPPHPRDVTTRGRGFLSGILQDAVLATDDVVAYTTRDSPEAKDMCQPACAPAAPCNVPIAPHITSACPATA